MNDMQNYPLFDEMCKAYQEVLDAKENAKAWNQEASKRMKNVNILIQAQRRINPDSPDRDTFLQAIKENFAADDVTPEPIPEEPEVDPINSFTE